MDKRELSEVLASERKREGKRQSKRALIIVGCLALFGILMVALAVWISGADAREAAARKRIAEQRQQQTDNQP